MAHTSEVVGDAPLWFGGPCSDGVDSGGLSDRGIDYRIRDMSRRSRAVASRNVSTLTPGGCSSPDFVWIASAIRCARSWRVGSGRSSLRAKKPSSTSRSDEAKRAMPLDESATAWCGSGIAFA
jgi:hypothetical protein